MQWGIPRLSNLFWSMGQIQQAHDILALLHARVTHPALRRIVEATGAAMAVHENRFDTGLAAAEAVLSNPNSPKQAVDWAAFAAGLALPVAGRGSEYEPIAARCRAEQKPTDGMIRVMVRYCDVLALTHTGQLDQTDRRVAEYTQFSSEGQFLGWAIAKIMAGLVATYRGKFPEAISSIEQALAALNAETSLPWRLPARLLLARAYAALAQTGQAERVLDDATEHTGRHVELHEPQRMIAKAWLTAARAGERIADAAAQAVPLHDQAGQRRRSAESAARTLQLAALCGGAITPAIRSAVRPLPLSLREREIAAMIAEGLSSSEIANKLLVSVRTVEGHIYRACIKLDVSDRDDLAAIVSATLQSAG